MIQLSAHYFHELIRKEIKQFSSFLVAYHIHIHFIFVKLKFEVHSSPESSLRNTKQHKCEFKIKIIYSIFNIRSLNLNHFALVASNSTNIHQITSTSTLKSHVTIVIVVLLTLLVFSYVFFSHRFNSIQSLRFVKLVFESGVIRCVAMHRTQC